MAQNEVHSERSSKFLKDLGIYAIGNLGSKIITFAMVAVYTHYISKSDMGYYDLCLTILFLIIPFVTLQLRDGAFRFLLETDDGKQRSKIITFVYRTLIYGTAVSLVASLLLALFTSIDYVWYCFVLLIVMSFYEVVTQVARGLGRNVDFVAAGIISSFGIGVFSILFVVVLPWGIAGIFIANILARVVALAYLEVRLKIVATYFKTDVDIKQVAHDLIKYSLPLLPGALCWWLTGSSDRWFINHFVGLEANGVYAVAFRFNSIILILATIFYQAWQETAILQYNSPDRDKFFSRVFNSYIGVLAILLTVYSFSLKIFYPVIVSSNYQESVYYLYPMGIAAVIFSLSAFFDMGYQCAKDTVSTLPAIVVAAIVNIVCNLLLVKYIGVYGAIATSIITYLVLFLWRLHDMKRYFKLSFYRNTAIAVLLIPLGAIPFRFIDSWWLSLLYMVVASALALMAIPKETLHEMKTKILLKMRLSK
ncbi:MAG: lipopolysaccharide biosynthesis protein [Muribaculaceae bacterium]|nr:lipopolysaccharide biosynthesis protein [Muribaculaceae bacterium]